MKRFATFLFILLCALVVLAQPPAPTPTQPKPAVQNPLVVTNIKPEKLAEEIKKLNDAGYYVTHHNRDFADGVYVLVVTDEDKQRWNAECEGDDCD